MNNNHNDDAKNKISISITMNVKVDFRYAGFVPIENKPADETINNYCWEGINNFCPNDFAWRINLLNFSFRNEPVFQYIKNNISIILVISAVGKTTNMLYKIINHEYKYYDEIVKVHKSLCDNIDIPYNKVECVLDELKRDIDEYECIYHNCINKKLEIISYGEYLSSLIVYEYLIKYCENDIIYYDVQKLLKNTNTHDTIDKYTLNINGEFYCDSSEINKLKEYYYRR